MIKTSFLLILIVFSAFFLRCTKSEDVKPNIILICADDLGWSDIGCYGSEVNTPNLDKLAKNGMRFNQFHNTSKCYPSRACLITGVYAQDCGYGQTYKNPISNAVTIGEVLQPAGYLTYWSGKHHGIENPYTRGFDHYYGLNDGCCNYFNPGNQREGEGFPAQKKVRKWCVDDSVYTPYTPEEKDFYTTDNFTNYALDYIQEANDKNKPFFLYLSYNAPHDPLMAWPEDIAKYKGKYQDGYEAIRKARYEKQLELGIIDSSFKLSQATHKPWLDLSEEEKEYEQKIMEIYAAMIDRMDQNIGRVINKLKETGMADNTIILFVSDNGASPEVVTNPGRYNNPDGEIGSLERWLSLGIDWANVGNTPFRYYKTYSYEGGINTPLIAYWPDKIAPNTLSDFPGHFIDIMPTILELSGAKYPKKFNGQEITPYKGQSLLSSFKSEEVKREKPLFWNFRYGKAMRLNEWKIVKNGDVKWDLYNLEKDPSETNNLAAEYPEKVTELDLIYQEWYKQYEEVERTEKKKKKKNKNKKK